MDWIEISEETKLPVGTELLLIDKGGSKYLAIVRHDHLEVEHWGGYNFAALANFTHCCIIDNPKHELSTPTGRTRDEVL